MTKNCFDMIKGCCPRSGKNFVAKLVVSSNLYSHGLWAYRVGGVCVFEVQSRSAKILFSVQWQQPATVYCRCHVYYLVYHFLQKNEAFSNALAPFVAKGLPVAICCGTSAWSNLAGNPEVAINNSSAAMRALRKNAGIGVINAHWSSHPSMTHVAFAYPSFLLNASLSWNSDIPETYLR